MILAQHIKNAIFSSLNVSDMTFREETKKENTSQCFSIPLAFANDHEKLIIVSFHGGGRMQERLLSMGICLNDEIEVIRRQDGGSFLIEKAGNRYALGGGMALKIQVIRKNDGKGIS